MWYGPAMRETSRIALLLVAAGLVVRAAVGLAHDPAPDVQSHLQALAKIRGVAVPTAPKIVTRSDEEVRGRLVAALREAIWRSRPAP